ncbi:MAG: cupin [Ignavibacteriae bacterium HGW-Ignavibacteriae-4]|jgi:quercetin dioxygenase-like cupin family protein|nr:MAG: cupin [Ignavibacteriae bacterium HGW-Ignavibacteriae-4]
MENKEIEKAQIQNVDKIIEYVPNSIVIKSIIKKPTGNVSVVALDAGEVLAGRITPFDTFVQVIDGHAEIIIDDNSNLLTTGESIIIPAHSSNTTKANVRFKMLTTIIKSGYEEVI